MNDKDIIQLYLNRDQRALSATAKKYGKYCTSIAKNILGNNEDAEECVNDTYLSTWNSIPPTIPTVESLPIENNNKVEDLQNNKEESVNIQESKSTEIEDTSETIIEDVPADNKGEYNEEVNSSDLTKDTSEFFGGSYTDANGKFVIVLTEDTPANRTAICKELGRSESNTTFVKGTYTLAYLTELQEKITNAMVNKEIPFVVTSGVYETTNNIIIRVTTNDEAELAKVYALDTIGGAIKVEFSAGAVVEELLLPLPKAE